jgi:cytochrome c biogenesis protein CcmG, thiol:disulfide interchange protein DsbE
MKGYLKVLTVMALVFFCAGTISCRGQAGKTTSAGPMAPDFTLKDLSGEDFSLSATNGKVVILDFWATWCPPCRMEIPHFEALYKEYKGRGLEIVGIALDQGGASDVIPFVKTNDVTYPIVIGNNDVAAAYGGIRGIPTTFILDRSGAIVEKFVGYREKEVFEEAIKKLL